MNRRYFLMATALSVMMTACAAPPAPPPAAAPVNAPTPQAGTLRLATTTSTQDSGLLDYLLPIFKEKTGIAVEVVAVGTGQALKLGEDGNADVLLVHARSQEDAYMAAGHGTRREDVMYNDFVIVGPASDPAGVKNAKTAKDAFTLLAEGKAPFISRGDKSGTHTKELALWKAAGIEPKGDWYASIGQGMGAALNMAGEKQAYTLSDRATYLARKKNGLALDIVMEGDKALLNPYGVIAVNPAKNSSIRTDLAKTFIDWLVSLEGQEKIAEFGTAEYGQSLFVPDAPAWKARQ